MGEIGPPWLITVRGVRVARKAGGKGNLRDKENRSGEKTDQESARELADSGEKFPL